MEFSKDNIVSKIFSKKILGGLDEFEVRDFLHVLAEEMRHLNQKIVLQNKKIQDQEILLKDYQNREHILKESISNAERWAEKVRQDAEENSSLVLEKAHNKSESLIQEARHSLQTVYTDIANLKRLQLQFKTGLKAALQVQMELLDQDPIFSSQLPSSDLDGILENKQTDLDSPSKTDFKPDSNPSSSEDTETSQASADQNETTSLDSQFSSSQEQEDQKTSESFKLPDEEMVSLRESLKSLDKSFS